MNYKITNITLLISSSGKKKKYCNNNLLNLQTRSLWNWSTSLFLMLYCSCNCLTQSNNSLQLRWLLSVISTLIVLSSKSNRQKKMFHSKSHHFWANTTNFCVTLKRKVISEVSFVHQSHKGRKMGSKSPRSGETRSVCYHCCSTHYNKLWRLRLRSDCY